MALLKLNGIARVVLVALTLLAGSSQVARADTTTLVCTGWRAATPTTMDLDEAKSLVTIHEGDTQIPGGSTVPGRTLGPFAAKFDEKTITFDTQDDGRNSTYAISRVTGTGSVNGTYADGSTMGQFDFSCHPGKNQF